MITNLQNTAAENRTRQARLAEERTNALATLKTEYDAKVAEYTRTYDEGIVAAIAAVTQADADIMREKAEHAIEEQRLREGVTHALGTTAAKRGRWANAREAEDRDSPGAATA